MASEPKISEITYEGKYQGLVLKLKDQRHKLYPLGPYPHNIELKNKKEQHKCDECLKIKLFSKHIVIHLCLTSPQNQIIVVTNAENNRVEPLRVKKSDLDQMIHIYSGGVSDGSTHSPVNPPRNGGDHMSSRTTRWCLFQASFILMVMVTQLPPLVSTCPSPSWNPTMSHVLPHDVTPRHLTIAPPTIK